MKTASAYYISHNGVQSGPFTMEQVIVQVREHVIVMGDYIWKEGFAEWLPIERICPYVASTAPMPEPPASSPKPSDAAPYSSCLTQGSSYASLSAKRYGLVSAYLGCLFNRYALFSGRACRSEFWFSVLMAWLVHIFGRILLYQLALQLGIPNEAAAYLTVLVILIFTGVTLVPHLAVLCRRIHDVGYSGKWAFIMFLPIVGPLVLLVICCYPSDKGANKYGSSPLPPAR